ncbi:hypothetical protein C8Q70DRAFT_944181 [Cubamyces menziesii]|nr:hypothetical protein C8Q70DRAFT_944181 [Cubamyces menziesii]
MHNVQNYLFSLPALVLNFVPSPSALSLSWCHPRNSPSYTAFITALLSSGTPYGAQIALREQGR